jgi:class 3 adenylate cyclase
VAPLISERTIHCKTDPASLWAVLADTERMNRAIGMDPVTFEPETAGAARFVGKTNLGGFDVSYEERPFEWVAGKSFRIERRMRSGPAAVVVLEYELTPEQKGAKITTRLSVTMRIALASPFARLSSGQTLSRMEKEILRVDDAIAAGKPPPPLPPRHGIRAEAYDRAVAALKKDPAPALVGRIAELVRTGSDFDVARMRPFELADEWKVDRTELLATMLRAVRAGLLELSWDMVCPSCRVSTGSVPTLAGLKEHGACQLCEIDFGLEVDESVEATFSASPSIRTLDKGPYCIGGPSRVPHVLTQKIVPANGEAELSVPTEPGRYRVFVRGGDAEPLEVAEGAPARVTADPRPEGGPPLRVAPGGVVVVKNPGPERHAKIERSTWAQNAATARIVTSLAEFRRDFSSDTLRPGASLRVSRVALFFSDLTGSTQLYSTVGDAAAFRLVHDHFDVVITEIERQKGALVKTIGDAVMAVFASDLDAVAAAVGILRAFTKVRAEGEHRDLTHIKLGVFAGPCYVVTANEMLDYFGQTVNIAARLQAQAESGELVVDQELAARAVAAGIIAEGDVKERYEAKLKGVDGGVLAARIAVG